MWCAWRRYAFLTESEKQFDRNTATEAVKLLLALGYDIVASRHKPTTALVQRSSRSVLRKAARQVALGTALATTRSGATNSNAV